MTFEKDRKYEIATNTIKNNLPLSFKGTYICSLENDILVFLDSFQDFQYIAEKCVLSVRDVTELKKCTINRNGVDYEKYYTLDEIECLTKMGFDVKIIS